MSGPEEPAPRRRLRPPRWGSGRRQQVSVAALCGLLGFGLATQVHSTHTGQALAGSRQEDLVGILSDLSARADRLRAQIASLQSQQTRLLDASDLSAAARAQEREQAQTLGILAGTVRAVGPGIVLTITDPRGSVHADLLVDALEELRDAGAEAMQLAGVRVVVSTYVLDAAGGGLVVDGVTVRPPYRLLVIGDPRTLAAALAIPGGVIDTVGQQPGARAQVSTQARVLVSALRGVPAAG